MKNVLSRSLAVLALACAAMSAHAQFYLENSGRVWNRVESNTSVSNGGYSESKAAGTANSYAAGTIQSNPIAGGVSQVLVGAAETSGSGMAWNISIDGGTGYANSHLWTDANVNGIVGNTNEHGTIQMVGKTDSGMEAPVGHGVDVDVVASRSQDGYAAGSDGGSFYLAGATQQNPVAGGAAIVASINSSQTSHSMSDAGAVTFTGGVPAGQTAAYRHANAGNVTEVSGNYFDPFAK